MKRRMAAPTLYNDQVGVARILEMPSGVTATPARSVSSAKPAAMPTEKRDVGRWPAPRKRIEVTTPAIMMQAIAPLPKGQKYRGMRVGNSTRRAVEDAQSVTKRTNQRAGAHLQRRVSR